MNIMGLRIGNGLDFHEFSKEEGEFTIPLGGLPVKHKHKIVAHSDGDVILHALCEAIFGALASGNIGTHFPPSESKWKNASSTIFLEHALKLLHEAKGEIINIDCTVICEAPKVMPHAQKIRENLASIIKIPQERISIKATTTEKLGFLGKGEGLGCTATILVLLK